MLTTNTTWIRPGMLASRRLLKIRHSDRLAHARECYELREGMSCRLASAKQMRKGRFT
jgi:hypothetical protein